MIPPTLLKEAAAAAMEYHPSDRHFMAGVQWLFTRLLEMSEAPNEIEATKWARSDLHDVQFANQWEARMFGHIAGQKYKSRLSQAALLKAKEEIERLEYNLSCLLDHATGGLLSKKAVDDYVERQLDKERARCEDYIKTIKLQGEKVERMERELKYIEGRIAHHAEAYSLDIFPDDKRDPCQTTAGRMGRHMCRVFLDYFNEARRALEEAE